MRNWQVKVRPHWTHWIQIVLAAAVVVVAAAVGTAQIYPTFPGFRAVAGQGCPSGRLGQRWIAHRMCSKRANQLVDCAEALKRAALLAPGRSSAVVVWRII